MVGHRVGRDAAGVDIHYFTPGRTRGTSTASKSMDRPARLASAKRTEAGPETGMVRDRRAGQFTKASTTPYRHYRKSKEQQPCDSGFPRKGPTRIPLRPPG